MRRVSSLALSLLIAVAGATPAEAEWFLDGYIGGSVTHNADVEVETATGTSRTDVTYGSSVTPGVRFGRWMDATPWLGFALDLSYFGPDTDIQVIPISALIMGRLAFVKTADVPDGALRPYAGIGPSLFISTVNGVLGPVRDVSDTTVDIGMDARLGTIYYVQPNFGLLAEYRFTHVSPTFSATVAGSERDVETTFTTHSFVVGVSYRF